MENHTQGRTRESLRFLRETQGDWTNENVDYHQGSILEHHLKSHIWSLYLQVKQTEYAIGQLDETLLREEDMMKGVSQDGWSTNQDLISSDHVNDYVNVLYRCELAGEGMGDRWNRVSKLLDCTHKQLLTPMDYFHRGILFSVTGEDEKMRNLLSDERKRECDELWKQLDLPETKIKWCHVQGDDRMDAISDNTMIQSSIDAIIQLNNVQIQTNLE